MLVEEVPLACVEVGGSGCETVVFDGSTVVTHARAVQPVGARLALAVPGLIEDGRVVSASNLDWYDVDPAVELGLAGPATVVCNDAEAAALGEAVLRANGSLPDLVYLGLGTGLGGAVVTAGAVAASNLFAHGTDVSSLACRCGRVGCLETVVGGWALPPVLVPADLDTIAEALARALESEPRASPALVVVGGGIARAHPGLVTRLGRLLTGRQVEGTGATQTVKSASAWGLRHLVVSPLATRAGGTG